MTLYNIIEKYDLTEFHSDIIFGTIKSWAIERDKFNSTCNETGSGVIGLIAYDKTLTF